MSIESAILRHSLEQIAADSCASLEELRNLAGRTLDANPPNKIPLSDRPHVAAAMQRLYEVVMFTCGEVPYEVATALNAAYQSLAAVLIIPDNVYCARCGLAVSLCACAATPAQIIAENEDAIRDLIPEDFGR